MKAAVATLPTPRAVIFDWDNTLVDTWPIIHEALRHTFETVGQKPWTFDETRIRVRRSMRDSFPEVFGEGWEKAGELYQQRYRAIHIDMLEALPGAEDVLKWLKKHGLYTVVVSNKKAVNLRKEVEHLGWGGLFDAIIGSDDAARDKPHADPVHMALERGKFAPGPDVWFIGDSEIDLECAQNTGCTSFLFGPIAGEGHEPHRLHYRGFPYLLHLNNHQETLRLFKANA